MNQISVLDLFCGVGGFSIGFENQGFNIVSGIDNNPSVQKTFTQNNRSTKFLLYDISSKIIEFEKEIDVIIGSPPCQGFSHARGNREAKSKEEKFRNLLPLEFIRWVAAIKPKVFLMENVYGFKTHKSGIADLIMSKMQKLGYFCKDEIIQSSDFGVPQSRKRYFLFGIMNDLKTKPFFPSSNGLKNKYTVRDAIEGLSKPFSTKNLKNELKRSEIHLDSNSYIKLISDNKKMTKTENHIAKYPNKIEDKIISCIPMGMAYRSDRRGKKSLGVWELAKIYKKRYNKEFLSESECKLLNDISKLRTNPNIKTRKEKGKEGYVPIDFLPYQAETILDLIKRNWLKLDNSGKAVDLTAQAGHRRRYFRVSLDLISPTITTQFTNTRDLVHPTLNRGLSLREGARLQSFPDDFIFHGSFNEIAKQIGNAVPPLLSRVFATHILNLGIWN